MPLVSMPSCTAPPYVCSELSLAIPECGLKNKSKGGGGVTRLNATAALIRAPYPPELAACLFLPLTTCLDMFYTTLVFLFVLLQVVVAVPPRSSDNDQLQFSLVSNDVQISNASLDENIVPAPDFTNLAGIPAPLGAVGQDQWHIREMFKRQVQACKPTCGGTTTSGTFSNLYCSCSSRCCGGAATTKCCDIAMAQVCCPSGYCCDAGWTCCGNNCCKPGATCGSNAVCSWPTYVS
jgi:hypothetical protein